MTPKKRLNTWREEAIFTQFNSPGDRDSARLMLVIQELLDTRVMLRINQTKEKNNE